MVPTKEFWLDVPPGALFEEYKELFITTESFLDLLAYLLDWCLLA